MTVRTKDQVLNAAKLLKLRDGIAEDIEQLSYLIKKLPDNIEIKISEARSKSWYIEKSISKDATIFIVDKLIDKLHDVEAEIKSMGVEL